MGIPEVLPGADVADLIHAAVVRSGLVIQAGDVIAVTHKIVSKAEGRVVRLAAVSPGRAATSLARETGKDPRLVELILQESRSVLRTGHGVIIAETRHGFICANAGIDHSNSGDPDTVVLLPVDPDASAAALADGLARVSAHAPSVIVTDSHGRPFRIGVVGVAIGAAGLAATLDLRGRPDRHGRALMATQVAIADAIAAAAVLVMGEAAEGTPAALVRGAPLLPGGGGATGLLRRPDRDLFRPK